MASTGAALTASYDAKDVILYALSLGFGSDPQTYDEELPFCYERKGKLVVLPTFAATLSFRARTPTDAPRSLPPFPPPIMKELLPRPSLRNPALSLAEYPVLHMWTRLEWYRTMPCPSVDSIVAVNLQSEFLSVVPKSVGTFVTTKTKMMLANTQPLCSMQATSLLLGLDPDEVNPLLLESPTARPSIPSREPDHVTEYSVTTNQALLYRLASGDTNSIHVQSDDGILLHGLCTLGMAARAILAYTKNPDFASMEGRFTKPVRLGDRLRFELWNEQSTVRFRVRRGNTTVLDNGCVVLRNMSRL